MRWVWHSLERIFLLVPTVAVGERVVHGWNPRSFAGLLGISYNEKPQLSPEELYVKLDGILRVTERTTLQVLPDCLETRTPGGERTLRDLGYHIFRLSLAYRDVAVGNRFPETRLLATVPLELTDGAAISGYGTWVREQLVSWFKDNKTIVFSQGVSTY